MALINITTPADGENADASDVASPLNTIVSEFNGNIDNANIKSGAAIATAKLANDAGITAAMIANDTITGAKINWSGTGADSGIWWEELGRTTLGVAGDTITVSGLPVRKYLKVICNATPTGGTMAFGFRFNADNSNNYNYSRTVDGAAASNSGAVSSIEPRSTTSVQAQVVMFITNVATKEKLVHGDGVSQGAAGSASSALTMYDFAAKWVNSSDAITSISANNSGTGDFAIGSEVVVLGHD